MLFADDKVDIFEHNLHDIALYFSVYDRELSQMFLTLDDIVQAYLDGENIFITQKDNISTVVHYIISNEKYLSKLGFSPYQWLFQFLNDAWRYQNDIFALLGKSGERNYIIVLQNTAEKRPNGGFFGSFGFLTLSGGHVQNMEIIDSYYPNWIAPDIKIPAPQRSWKFIPDKLIGFISANKFGFTNIDGRNIKNLYNQIFNNKSVYGKRKDVIEPGLFERTFNKKVDGVIFVRSDVMTTLLSSLQQQFRAWEFLNANTDIIKAKAMITSGQTNGDFSNKKAKYIAQINDFFHKHIFDLMKSFIKNFDSITKQRLISIYLTPTTNLASSGLLQLLDEYNLVNNYDSWFIYARDSNDSYNKVDTFVHKTIGLYDSEDHLVRSGSNDMLDITNIKSGTYFFKIRYELSIPKDYIDYMHHLEDKYGIQMTERELGILWLQPAKDYLTAEKKYRATRATVYVPLYVKIKGIVWDYTRAFSFTPTFANGQYYEMKMVKNNMEKGVRLEIEIK